MDYISKKVSSLTGEAVSDINEGIRKRDDSKFAGRQQQPHDGPDVIQPTVLQAANFGGYTQHYTQKSPLSNGFPFGGDSIVNPRHTQAPPPPIGFRADLVSQEPPRLASSQAQLPEQQAPNQPTQPVGGSEESLYEGDGWTRLWFQRVMLLSLARLLLFVRKVYEDFYATKHYNLTGQTGHFLVSAAALFLPTIVFTIYRVSRYLQLALPSLRAAGAYPKQSTPTNLAIKSRAVKGEVEDKKNDHDATRALMSSPGASSGQQLVTDRPSSPSVNQIVEDDGLVTARQSPSNLEDFQDSKSQQDIATNRIEKSRANVSKLESVDMDKLGYLPDKDTARVAIGTSEQLLHGVLFVFWQLKRQVDVMGYLVERACLWRKPREAEKEELGRLSTGSDGLEWFQDFYAAFLAILTQVYTLGLYWSKDSNGPINATSVNAATSALAGSNSPKSIGDVQLSPSATLLNNVLDQRVFMGRDALIMSQLIVSSAVIASLLVAVRRRDDGPLTLGLSMIGWGSMFAARIMIIGLAFVHIGWHIMLPLVMVHILAITGWIYKIAIDSHNDKASEREMEARWDDETAAEIELERRQGREGVESAAEPKGDSTGKANNGGSGAPTDQWSIMEHLVLLTQIFILFAIPSLFYWPVMFNLKFHQRPLKYLLLILTQNSILIPAIWYGLQNPTPGQLYLLGAVGAFSIVGFIFVSLYICCKPSLTEYFARADELFNHAEKCGIYFEFCSRVFKMPELSKHSFARLMDQTAKAVEVQVGEDDN